jgi:hypothetical protein
MVHEDMTEVKIEINKTCGCGEFHQYLPGDAVLKSDIYWFQCNGRGGICHSTLTYIPELTQRRLDREIERQKKQRIRDEVTRQNEYVKRSYGIKPRQEK